MSPYTLASPTCVDTYTIRQGALPDDIGHEAVLLNAGCTSTTEAQGLSNVLSGQRCAHILLTVGNMLTKARATGGSFTLYHEVNAMCTLLFVVNKQIGAEAHLHGQQSIYRYRRLELSSECDASIFLYCSGK
jgi:hypothetical protein